MNCRFGILLTMLALAVLSNVTSPAQAGSEDSWPRQPTASATDKHRYIIDVVGKQVRLVGPRFYTNLVGKMNFPGRDGLSQKPDGD